MRILIVEDETRIADFLQRGLRAEGHFPVVASDGESGLALALEGDFDLLLLDMMLPGIHGREICQQLRMNKINTPLIILSAMDSLDDVIAGLRMGADDYMTKPFSFEELLARVRSQERRQAQAATAALQASAITPAKFTAGDFTLDPKLRTVARDGQTIELTEREAELLALLMHHAGQPLSRNEIFHELWEAQGGASINVVDVYVGYLRRKLGAFGTSGKSVIRTVRGLGFIFRA